MRKRTTTVATVLEPAERERVAAAGSGCFEALHGDSLDDAIRCVRYRGAEALFLSVHRCAEADLPRVAQFVHEFPTVPAFALISRGGDRRTHQRVLHLGASGVRAVVDVSVPGGWQQLRDALREPVSPAVAAIRLGLEADLRGVPPDCQLFFDLVARRAPSTPTIGALLRALKVVPNSIVSRFVRAQLPSPRTYLVHMRLLHCAWLFGSEGLGVTDVAHRLEYSSPQAFGRHVRVLLGITPLEYRRRYPFPVAVEFFRATLLTPYRVRLLTFHPFGTLPGDPGHRRGVGAGRSG